MKHFGLMIDKNIYLFDVETGEILANDETNIQRILQENENNYLLQVF